MSRRLSGKVCIITGTGGSMGRAAALAFAREGASVVGCDLNVESAEATDGYRATYRGDDRTAQALQSLIEAERVCCPDFDWRLEREGELVRLEVSYLSASSG